ncbi:putative mitochondrial hypothetical protein [Leptomonas pyrrhocoris]|uniref:Fe2OG dioxygenase domain-containing protein n=1 Tax=Leptomonas pyrrhocoris TaxID=157538 RepID=A0A0N0VDB2_LEPPY|nr:putative mitochondrial hypothetical protein [Leptomonas pyrrhocoris]XP_015653492.1 putative mitochondrial hypothetical protein [Leptomonas pyrrhocoris]KPA75052.1 putative mitochondrial hypothetical protein [Leptomonas pyrrhocoris]KPA75053.1 putative mitochondrial hypothetical protein [Leptomonas pyrrhocoris]|eukprot:XP_015653491.1 putative mitochondrial hypothetical protein [Leptomonas pyrrhocoris]
MNAWKLVRLFHPSEVSAAFAALQTDTAVRYFEDASGPLARYLHRRHGDHGDWRDHIEVPLHHFLADSDVYRQLPPEVRHICAGLHEAARAFVEVAVREPSVLPAPRDGVLHNLGRKSVLRVLRYPAGSGCRPHIDPGLCTALLTGSAGGLDVNTLDELPVSFTNRPGDYTSHANVELAAPTAQPSALANAEEEETNVLNLLPNWEPVVTTDAGEAVVMAGNMMDVISRHTVPGVLHRVRRDWGGESVVTRSAALADSASLCRRGVTQRQPQSALSAASANVGTTTAADLHDKAGHAPSVYRFNIIVELRPAQAKRWYAVSRTG